MNTLQQQTSSTKFKPEFALTFTRVQGMSKVQFNDNDKHFSRVVQTLILSTIIRHTFAFASATLERYLIFQSVRIL